MYACLCSSYGQSSGDRFGVRAFADIGIGSACAVDYDFAASDSKSSMSTYGVAFDWTFWRAGSHSLALGIGFGLAPTSFSVTSGAATYSYAAGAEADMDANEYIRHTRMSPLKQTIGMTQIVVPLTIEYAYRFHSKWSVYGRAGFRFGFGGTPSVRTIVGTIDSYGVYPEYGNLVMDDSWLNDFGEQTLVKSHCTRGVSAGTVGILAGTGVKFRVYKPLYLSAGVTYAMSFSNVLKNNGLKIADGTLAVAAAPVTYTVAEGLQCKPLTDGLTKCRLNRVGVEIGIELHF